MEESGAVAFDGDVVVFGQSDGVGEDEACEEG